ncbi:MAG: DNA mismatch repair endonuclease MutL [Bacilli bacterium]|jgi:DNA mismatch repair protein MutL|nr:DNA mismatch repair endonuclease MutL [Bacilli bacterium]
MNKIKILEESIVSKIAAGEVIESPTSVIKELVENSIDAHASKIDITIINNGLQLIQVVDNGIGMSKEDLLLCTKVHATSKINNQYDLNHINTLGFRGEALASITNVAMVKIATNNDNKGYFYNVNDDLLSEGYQNKGTKISVNNLFYNVPARFKFLSSNNRIYSSIVELIYSFSLMYPNIAFSLTNDGKNILTTSGNNNIIEILNAIYGLDIAENMNYFKTNNDDFMIDGYYSNKDITRSNKRAIYLFINKRLIQDNNIVQAIIDGYDTLLMERRFPIVILNITCDNQLVDVNVHPAKKEVRLDKKNELCNLITNTLKDKLSIRPTLFNKAIDNNKINNMQFNFNSNDIESKNYQNNNTNNKIISEVVTEDYSNTLKDNDINNESNNIKEDTNRNYLFDVIGQFACTYILISNEKGLQMIDQHAAMERINYENIKNNFNKELTYYDLIVPIIINLSFSESIKIMEFKDYLIDLGLNFEVQANNDLLIRSIPSWIEEDKAQEVIENIVSKLLEYKKIIPFDIVKDDLILASCKMSLKANTKLSNLEMTNLVNRLLNCSNNDHCPHGRPIFLTLTLNDIEKMFKRIV